MSFSDSFSCFTQFPNGVDSIGNYWNQYPLPNEQQSEVNSSEFVVNLNHNHDHDHPPLKRSKSSLDNNNNNNIHTNLGNRATPTQQPQVNQPTGKIFFKTRLCAKFRMGQCRNGENCNFAHGEEDLRKPPPNWQELVGGGGRSDDRGSNNGGGGSNGNNGGENWEDDDRIIHKMKLCKKFYNGEECPYGERCNFLHKEPAKFREGGGGGGGLGLAAARFRDTCRESSAISIGTTGSPLQQQQSRGADQFDVQRSAAVANVGSGVVVVGGGGVDVLRGNSRPVYWKTKLCTKFEITGLCPFGDNCHFAHGQAELLLPGGRPAEAEPAITSSTPLKPVSTPANDSTIPIKIDIGVPSNHEGQGKKCLLKWKGTKKINRIYGDWIDDMPLILPNEVET